MEQARSKETRSKIQDSRGREIGKRKRIQETRKRIQETRIEGTRKRHKREGGKSQETRM